VGSLTTVYSLLCDQARVEIAAGFVFAADQCRQGRIVAEKSLNIWECVRDVVAIDGHSLWIPESEDEEGDLLDAPESVLQLLYQLQDMQLDSSVALLWFGHVQLGYLHSCAARNGAWLEHTVQVLETNLFQKKSLDDEVGWKGAKDRAIIFLPRLF
jgi:hypothetical protein